MNILDLVLLAVIFVFTLMGYQKGLIRSLVGFVGYLAASMAAAALGRTAAVYAYQNLLYDPLVNKITAVLQQAADQSVQGKLQALESGLPAFLINPVRQGMSGQSLTDALNRSITDAAPAIAQMLSPAVINIARVVITVCLFSIFIALVRSLVRVVSAVFRLPVLRQINSLLGGVFGLCTGGAIVLLLCLLLELVLPMTKDGMFGITQKELNASMVYQTLYQNNPVYSKLPEA